MEKIHLISYKISAQLPLKEIARFFQMHGNLKWSEYILLEEKHLEVVFKYRLTNKQVYLFQFGCITFINFSINEISAFLEYLTSLAVKVDQNLFTKFNEEHVLGISMSGMCKLWDDNSKNYKFDPKIIEILSIVLAKSVALHKIEADLNNLLDEAERFIYRLQKGWLGINSRRLTSIVAKILRFEYESIHNIRIYDRTFATDTLQAKEIYDALEEHYELYERFDIIENKIEDLRSVIHSYSTLSYKSTENRQYVFEIFLLVLFPLVHILQYILDHYHIGSFYQLFRNL